MSARLAVLAAACLLACHCPCGTRSGSSPPPEPASKASVCSMTRPGISLLPRVRLPEGLAVVEQPRGYVGEQLFDLIDGGAVQYFDHGFVWALAGTYENEAGVRVTVELYHMGSAANARALFQARAVPSAEAVMVGEAARYMTGSVEFLRSCFVMTVTSFAPEEVGREAVIAIAGRIDEELQG